MRTKAVRFGTGLTPTMRVVVAILLVGWAGPAWGGPQAATPESSDITTRINELAAEGGSLQDVIRVLGEPQSYVWSDQTFTKDNLPDRYIAFYTGGLSVFMAFGKVREVRLHGGPTEYRFAGKLAIGSSLEEVLAVLGEPGKTVTGGELTYEDNVLYRDCTPRGGTGTLSYYARPDKRVRVFMEDDRVTALLLACDDLGPRRPRATAKAVQPVQPVEPVESVKEYDDVRGKDLGKMDFRWRGNLLATLTFNQATVWPPEPHMPLGGDPAKLMEAAKNPGLGVRDLHAQGITGKGVCVAIIDQPLYLDHPEFAGKIAAYHDVGCRSEWSMHGPAVASLLVGSSCGTAPEATLYHVAAPSWTKDTAYQAQALDWIVEQNAKLPADRKIRVVSVSASPSGPTTLFTKNTEMWDAACKRAEKAGLLVLDCTQHHGFISRCWLDPNDPENVSKCTPGAPGNPQPGRLGQLFVPSCPRTTAEERQKGQCKYIYWGRGGLSWTIPYCAGVLAMGWQLRPEIPPEAMRGLLFKSAYVKDRNTRIINPPEFIRAVREWRSPRFPATQTRATEPSEIPPEDRP
ncbi:MAG: hypothetical protein MUP47_06750 [Phycisphaerae bacterium]|nr:hypothetical protein [Phycisphaerae bacterium]